MKPTPTPKYNLPFDFPKILSALIKEKELFRFNPLDYHTNLKEMKLINQNI